MPERSNDILGWGILSTAFIKDSLIPGLPGSARRNRLRAITSRREVRAKAEGVRWGCAADGFYEELLADPDIDRGLASHGQARAGSVRVPPRPRWLRALDLARQGAEGDPRVVKVVFVFSVPKGPANIRYVPGAVGII